MVFTTFGAADVQARLDSRLLSSRPSAVEIVAKANSLQLRARGLGTTVLKQCSLGTRGAKITLPCDP